MRLVCNLLHDLTYALLPGRVVVQRGLHVHSQ